MVRDMRGLNPNLMYQQMIHEDDKYKSSSIGIIFRSMTVKARRKSKILKLKAGELCSEGSAVLL